MNLNPKPKSIFRNLLLNNKNIARITGEVAHCLTKTRSKENVVMFHPGRCGSSVVAMLLNQHPKVNWIGEIFKKSYEKYPWVQKEPYSFMRFRKRICMSSVFGMEIVTEDLFIEEVNNERVLKPLKKLGFEKFILLKRMNLLSRLVSSLVAEKIGKWNTKESIEAPKVEVPSSKERIMSGFEKYERFYSKIEKEMSPQKGIVLTYEKDVRRNPKKAHEKICKFLDLEAKEVSVETEKINKRHVTKRISNICEIKEILEGTKYEWMLYKS